MNDSILLVNVTLFCREFSQLAKPVYIGFVSSETPPVRDSKGKDFSYLCTFAPVRRFSETDGREDVDGLKLSVGRDSGRCGV